MCADCVCENLIRDLNSEGLSSYCTDICSLCVKPFTILNIHRSCNSGLEDNKEYICCHLRDLKRDNYSADSLRN